MIEIEKESKISLITDDMILCIENPKDAMRKLLKLDLNNEFGKSAGYEINRQKSLGNGKDIKLKILNKPFSPAPDRVGLFLTKEI